MHVNQKSCDDGSARPVAEAHGSSAIVVRLKRRTRIKSMFSPEVDKRDTSAPVLPAVA